MAVGDSPTIGAGVAVVPPTALTTATATAVVSGIASTRPIEATSVRRT
jgi:hypothetical protein